MINYVKKKKKTEKYCLPYQQWENTDKLLCTQRVPRTLLMKTTRFSIVCPEILKILLQSKWSSFGICKMFENMVAFWGKKSKDFSFLVSCIPRIIWYQYMPVNEHIFALSCEKINCTCWGRTQMDCIQIEYYFYKYGLKLRKYGMTKRIFWIDERRQIHFAES